jgi:hypothetical protein
MLSSVAFPSCLHRTRIVFCVMLLCGGIAMPVREYALAEENGTCTCSGEITANILVPNNVFNGYCSDSEVKKYCSFCSDGKATCTGDFVTSKSSCDMYASNPKNMAVMMGVPSDALSLLDVTANCSFKGSDASTKAGSTNAAGESGSGAVATAKTGSPTTLPDPLQGVNIPKLIGNIVRTFSGIAGAVALAMFVWGGVKYIISGGDPSKVKAARGILINASWGIILIFGAYTFVDAIIDAILAPPRGV